MRILSVLSSGGESKRNRAKHEHSWLTAISDAGSTPAASTSLRPLGDGSGSACQVSLQNRLSWLNAGEGGLPHAIRSALLVIPDQHKRRPVKRMRVVGFLQERELCLAQ